MAKDYLEDSDEVFVTFRKRRRRARRASDRGGGSAGYLLTENWVEKNRWEDAKR